MDNSEVELELNGRVLARHASLSLAVVPSTSKTRTERRYRKAGGVGDRAAAGRRMRWLQISRGKSESQKNGYNIFKILKERKDDPETMFDKMSLPGVKVERDRLEDAVSSGGLKLFNRQLNGVFLRREATLWGAWGSGVRKDKRCSEPVGRDGSPLSTL